MHATELRLRNQQPTARELGRQYRENVRAQDLLTAKQMETENTVRRMAENVGAQVAFDATISDAAGHDSAADGSWEAYLEENRLPLETGEVTEAQLRAEYEALQSGGGSGTMNENGGVGYGEEITARDTGRNVPENGQWGRVDGRGETTGAFSYDRPVVSRAEEYAGEYGIQVIPVSDEILAQRGHEAETGFTSDGTVYMSENMPEEFDGSPRLPRNI